MEEWTIIRVTTDRGYYYDAIAGGVDPTLDIDFDDGDYVTAGSYEIVLDDLSEDEMNEFMDMPPLEREAVYALAKGNPS